MDKDLAIKIFEQCDIEEDVGRCKNCPRHDDPFHICPGCLNAAKDSLLNYIKLLENQVTEYQDEIFARDNNWYDMQD